MYCTFCSKGHTQRRRTMDELVMDLLAIVIGTIQLSYLKGNLFGSEQGFWSSFPLQPLIYLSSIRLCVCAIGYIRHLIAPYTDLLKLEGGVGIDRLTEQFCNIISAGLLYNVLVGLKLVMKVCPSLAPAAFLVAAHLVNREECIFSIRCMHFYQCHSCNYFFLFLDCSTQMWKQFEGALQSSGDPCRLLLPLVPRLPDRVGCLQVCSVSHLPGRTILLPHQGTLRSCRGHHSEVTSSVINTCT